MSIEAPGEEVKEGLKEEEESKGTPEEVKEAAKVEKLRVSSDIKAKARASVIR